MTSSWWKRCRIAGATVAALALAGALAAPAALAQDTPAPGAAADTAAVDSSSAAPAPEAAAPPAPAVVPPSPAPPAAPALSPREAEAQEKAKEREEKRAARAKERAEKQAKIQAELDEDLKAGRPWVRGANWLSLRIGTASSGVQDAPDGSIAFGFGAHHFMSRRWAWGLHADVDVLGKFRGATEMEVPLTAELSRHFRWGGDTFRPHIGIGGGAYYHRTYRTGSDLAEVRPGFYVSGGFNSPIAARSLLGLTVRMTVQGSADSDNPVFPNEESTAVHWSFKLNYLRWQ